MRHRAVEDGSILWPFPSFARPFSATAWTKARRNIPSAFIGVRAVRRGSAYSGVPSMTLDLEVKVLWGVDRSDPSQPQGEKRERLAESSGARDLRGDEQKPDTRRTGLRVSGPETATPSRSRSPDVDPALVQGQPRRLTWGDLARNIGPRSQQGP